MNFKRVALHTAIPAAVLSLAALFISDLRFAVPAGILLGAALSLWKTRQYAFMLRDLAGDGRARGIRGVLYGLSLLLIGATMTACVLADPRLFGGFCAGVLLPLPAITLQAVRAAKGGG